MSVTAERDLLLLILDTLIPEGEGFPGAGAVALDHIFAVAARSARLAALLSRGLRAIDEMACNAGARGFASLEADACEAVLRRVEQADAEFFEALVQRTYEGYYSHASVIARLGLDPRPLHPRGHSVNTVDAPELGRVVSRGPIYRRT